jgi:hypothetical protein
MNSIPASRYMRTEKVPKRYATGHDSKWITTGRGTAATNFHGRARVKRLRLRKLQRQARQVGRGLRTRRH